IVAGVGALGASIVLNLNRPHIGFALVASGSACLLILQRKRSVPAREADLVEETGRLRSWGPAFIVLLLAPTTWTILGRSDLAFFIPVSMAVALLVRPALRASGRTDAAICLVAIVLMDLELLWRMSQFSVGPVGVDPW